LIAVLFWLGLAGVGAAEIYRWTDDSGKLHFSQNLNAVPGRYRAQAEANAQKAPPKHDRMQVYDIPSTVAPASRSKRPAGGGAGAGQTFRIAVQRAGTSMRVEVRLNGNVTAPFLIDTGASDVVIPASVAKQLGLALSGPKTRTKAYATANGIVEQVVVRLDSVELGGARARNVPASISPSMPIGLLGLSFFNHFNYHFDSARGIVTLKPNGLVESGSIRGGRSKAQWRAEFAQIKARIAMVEKEIARTPSSHGRELRRLDGVVKQLEAQYGQVEIEADEVQVPFSWRD